MWKLLQLPLHGEARRAVGSVLVAAADAEVGVDRAPSVLVGEGRSLSQGLVIVLDADAGDLPAGGRAVDVPFLSVTLADP